MVEVLVVADVCLYREGLADLLDRRDELDVVGKAASVDEAVEQARRWMPQVAVIDLRTAAGPAAVRDLTGAVPGLRVVALSVVEEPDEVVAWAEAGISAYVSRDGSIDDVVGAITAAVCDELPCTGRIAAALLRRVTALAADPQGDLPAARLTRREREIVALIDEGLANKEIATRLQIQVPTVKNHVHNVLEKLGVRRRSEAARRLRRQDRLEATVVHAAGGNRIGA
jgi:two-component system, NarL family, nitrate/nitrite response regulator NarL